MSEPSIPGANIPITGKPTWHLRQTNSTINQQPDQDE
jgi:hypothetical protein